MFDSQKFYSPLKHQSIRSRKFRFRSVEPLRSNKTSSPNLNNPEHSLEHQQLNPINMTEFVFNQKKRKHQISRIIDDYFEQKPHTISTLNEKESKTFSLINFTKLNQLNQIPHKPFKRLMRTKLSIPIDLNDLSGPTEDSLNCNLSIVQKQKQTGFLPPIFEQEPETTSKFNVLLMKMVKDKSASNLNTPRKSSKNEHKQRKLEVNEKFIVTTNKTNSDIKKCFTGVGMDYLYLQLKSYYIIRQLEVQQMFNYQRGSVLSYKFFNPFKKMLYNISEQALNGQICSVIAPSSFYYSLFNNNNEILLSLIKSLLTTLIKVKNKLINTNITLNNLHYHKQNLIIDSWASSCIKEQKVKKVIFPVLRNQTEWLVSLQYLPPEFLESVLSEENQYDLFQNPSSIDMWSIGTLILEIITLIPLNAKDRFIISEQNGSRNKDKDKKVMRRGIYMGRGNDIGSLIKRQKKLCGRLKPQLEKLGEISQDVSPKVMELMAKMLKLNPKQRLTPQQGLRIMD